MGRSAELIAFGRADTKSVFVKLTNDSLLSCG